MIFCTANFMPRINSIDFYQNRPKIKLFLPKKIIIFRELGDPPLHPMPTVAGGLAFDPNCLRWLGDPPPDPRNVPPIANFWLRACLKKNLLHVTAGIHLY